ncbi:hypothetical protein PR048_030523 [Dryococelus australis]|uniref:Uncharacterized protein n=1 Tax=Dryococelus australis TaxID=614101 RepID=A0ABQ9GA09_9NEOP|nr:hypothetical protein PR048_030523 [Dryococelus australis]
MVVVVKPKDVLDSIAQLQEPNGSTVTAITKFLRRNNNFFTRALCEQGLLTCKNRRTVATKTKKVVRRRRSRRGQSWGKSFREEAAAALCEEKSCGGLQEEETLAPPSFQEEAFQDRQKVCRRPANHHDDN